MKVHTQQQTPPVGELLSFMGEAPVPLDQVEERLAELWRHASETCAPAGGEPLTRACLWNVVAYHAHPTGHPGHDLAQPSRLEALLAEVTTSVPARVIHLEQWPEDTAPGPHAEVQAWVASNCLRPESGRNLVCCEEVHLAGYGERGQSHFPALVRALRAPDLPVALLWLDEVPRRGRVLGQLLGLSERILIDAQHTSEPDTLLAVRDLVRNARVRVVDLGWMRLRPLRHLVAQFFDPPGRAGQLQALEGITLETDARGRNAGYLLLGWLLSRCGYTEVSAVDLGPGADTHRWSVRRGDARSFPVDFQVREGYGGLDGIFCIALEAGGDTFALHDVDPEHMSLEGPDRKLPSVALRETDDPGLVAEALGGGRPDRVYADALAMASKLVATEQWMR